MVTKIILNEDIHPTYSNINHWIIQGITNDAIWCCGDKWSQDNVFLVFLSSKLEIKKSYIIQNI